LLRQIRAIRGKKVLGFFFVEFVAKEKMTNEFWHARRVMVTGGNGFLGNPSTALRTRPQIARARRGRVRGRH
jgi:hypothetical protein